ncbi:putative ribonuclease H-like domain-containing protein [Tanacetum coccineum]
MVKPVWNNAQRVNHRNFAKKSHPCAKKNMVPRAVLMKSGLVSVNTARQVNTTHSKTTVNDARPMGKNVNTAKPKVVVNVVQGNNFNAVKASTCWVWKPKTKVLDYVSKHNSASITLKKFDYVDAQGRSKHMIGYMSYLTDYEEIDGGYVAFGGWSLLTSEVTLELGTQGVEYGEEGKQHKASCKSKTENSISLPLHLLHMDLFSPTFVKSLMKKMYYLVVTDDFNRFTWVFFLATKDETSGILKSFITGIKNLVDYKVKLELLNKNGVAERRNRILIEAARTMLADSKLPTTFWAEAVNNAWYNRVLVVKRHNKTPYELFHGRTPTLSFMRPFGSPVTILNTIDHLGKFDGKA